MDIVSTNMTNTIVTKSRSTVSINCLIKKVRNKMDYIFLSFLINEKSHEKKIDL